MKTLTSYIVLLALLLTVCQAAVSQTKTAAKPPAAAAGETTAAAATDLRTGAATLPDYAAFSVALDTTALSEILQDKGPYTVFAPTNDAFGQLPNGLYAFMMSEEDKGTLSKMMASHIVNRKLDSKQILKDIKSGRGKATYRTLSGSRLVLSRNDEGLVIITDDLGRTANIGVHDLQHTNGLMHAIDQVLIPQEF